MRLTGILLSMVAVLSLVILLVVGGHFLVSWKMERLANDDAFINRVADRVQERCKSKEPVPKPEPSRFESWSRGWESQRDQ